MLEAGDDVGFELKEGLRSADAGLGALQGRVVFGSVTLYPKEGAEQLRQPVTWGLLGPVQEAHELLPSALGLLLMTSAGIGWAIYSLAGRAAPEPIGANARSFLWSGLLSVGVALAFGSAGGASRRGITLALISGSVTSGLGYALWYRVLPKLSVMQAAASQLSVPVIAAFGAAALLDEQLSAGLVASGMAVLTGVGLVLWTRDRGRLERPAKEPTARKRT